MFVMSIGMYFHFNQSFNNFACNNTFIHISTASLYRASQTLIYGIYQLYQSFKQKPYHKPYFKFYNGWFGLNSLLYTNAFGVSIQNSFDFKRNANQIYPPPLPFLEKNREIFFFQQNTSSFKIHPIRLCLQVQYVCKCYFFKGKCLQNNCHKHYM